jgi:L-alanine-DL-glutamate epimerase-like enolase superfamily enzyme
MSGPPGLWTLRFKVERCPLIKPYELSFGSLTGFDSVLVLAEQENWQIGIGEAVPLPGYNSETLETVSTTVATLVANGKPCSRAEITERCREVRADHPFAASAVMTALDMPYFLERYQGALRFPICAPVTADSSLPELRRAIQAYLSAGYVFIKVKVGRDLEQDIAAARCVLCEWPNCRFGVVFDPNQAYSCDQALAYARVLRDCQSDRLQWLEQPVDRRDWDAMERICRAQLVRIVLDESIYNEADLLRAAQIGAHGVKLKLMKNFGMAETLSLARNARKLGLVVVLGNGVATDIGNIAEYLVLSAGQGMFASAAECNGFAKLKQQQLGALLKVDNGHVICHGGIAEIATCLGQVANRIG